MTESKYSVNAQRRLGVNLKKKKKKERKGSRGHEEFFKIVAMDSLVNVERVDNTGNLKVRIIESSVAIWTYT